MENSKDEVQKKRVPDDTPSWKRMEILRMYYYHILSEDPLDGTAFDLAVLSALKELEEKFPRPPEKKVGTHLRCGGVLIKIDGYIQCERCRHYICGIPEGGST
ncbi:MAG: hypothetical protein NUV61_00530 [Candidatus Azambacteria bacterium]|nr:hypothetical protein [Candidatus Azambacteria bacterium]